jgi:hypothetical protein
MPTTQVNLTEQDQGPEDTVSGSFLQQIAKHPDVENWLISCTEKDQTRAEYLEHLARFLNWCSWTPTRLIEIKREALQHGEPMSQVETQIRRYHEALRQQGYAGKTRAKYIAAIISFILSKGYTIPKKLIRLDTADKYDMRVPEQPEIELFIQYAGDIGMKLLYTLMTESPCRPRVFPSLQWNWLEPNWEERQVVHVVLPKQFRASGQGPRKFEPICFLGPKSIELMKQVRAARIREGKTPHEADRILKYSRGASRIAVTRDYERLVQLGLIRASRTNGDGGKTEQRITMKSWRKYQFNIIDSCVDISPEWRKMLKGRDLQTERYYSKENIEALREIYITKVYPKLWPNTATRMEDQRIKDLERQVAQLTGQYDTIAKLITKG